APIASQTSQLLSATLGRSVLIPCSLPVPPMNLRWFYWQEDQSSNILFHWDPKGQTRPVADKYMNRCQAFISEYSSGNISIRLDNVSVEDDLKTFWAYVSVYDEQRKLPKLPEQRCKSTLQVSSPYKDQLLTINKNNNSATCTAHGGYPEPKVSWTGLNKSNAAQLDLQDAETSLQRDPTEKTFSVTSCVSVKELQSVTCIITNPHSHKIMKRTAKIDDPAPITSQTPQLLSATLGSSVLIPCSLPVPLLRLRWFYWQEDQSSNILFHWDRKNQTLPVADKYMNRCQAFISEYSSGNISIRLDNVSVEDDLKTFWTYVSVYDEKRKLIKPSEQRCKSTLQVSSPYKDQLLTINKNNNSATCTTHGGYPEPKVSWTGLNKSNAAQLDLQDAETSLQRDPTEKTFSVTSCVSVKELQSVTCIITNPHSHKIIKRTAKIDDPGKWTCPQDGVRHVTTHSEVNLTGAGPALLRTQFEPLMLEDDRLSLEVTVSGNQPAKKLCQMTLYIAAPFQEPNIEINQTEMTATCSTKGGYPKPELKWSSGDGETGLEPRELATNTTVEGDATYSVSSTVNITGFQKVTCTVYNPTSNQTLSATKDMSPVPDPTVALDVNTTVVPYTNVSLAVNEETMTAVCTTQGGFPKALVEWRLEYLSNNSQHFVDPGDVDITAVQDRENHLYSIRSSIDISGGLYRSVICLFHNPTLNVAVNATHVLNKGKFRD
ncbi:hypothetical protein GBF38_018135, partial [Nibea albiflora]